MDYKLIVVQYFFITHIILTILAFVFLYGILVKKTKYITLLNKINSLTRLFIFVSFIFIIKVYTSIFNDTYSGYILYLLAIISIVIGYIGLSTYYFNNNINFYQFAMIMFLIGISFLLYKSVIIDKNISLDNHAYSFWDSVIYFISFSMLLLYGFNNDYRFLLSGILILIVGRLLSVYIAYQPLKSKYNQV